MSFTVEPQALRTYARQISDIHRVADAAGRYVTQHGSIDFKGGLIGELEQGHDALLVELKRMLVHLEQIAAASTKTLTTAAQRYEQTDHHNAAALDATYPAVPRPATGSDAANSRDNI